MNKLIKIHEYTEGITKYYCLNCNHITAKPKDKPLKEFACYYCGNKTIQHLTTQEKITNYFNKL